MRIVVALICAVAALSTRFLWLSALTNWLTAGLVLACAVVILPNPWPMEARGFWRGALGAYRLATQLATLFVGVVGLSVFGELWHRGCYSDVHTGGLMIPFEPRYIPYAALLLGVFFSHSRGRWQE